MDPNQTEDPGKAGFTANLGALGRHLFALFVTRVELAALELGEARNHLGRVLLLGALGVLLLCFALGGWTALVVALAWDALGWKILLLVAAFYTVLAVIVLLSVRAMLATDKFMLPSTVAELRADRDALFRHER